MQHPWPSHLGSYRCCLTTCAPWWRSHSTPLPLSNTSKKTTKGLFPARATCRISAPSSSTRCPAYGLFSQSTVPCFAALHEMCFTETLGATRINVALPRKTVLFFSYSYSDLRVSAVQLLAAITAWSRRFSIIAKVVKPIVNAGVKLWHFVGLTDGDVVEMHLR